MKSLSDAATMCRSIGAGKQGCRREHRDCDLRCSTLLVGQCFRGARLRAVFQYRRSPATRRINEKIARCDYGSKLGAFEQIEENCAASTNFRRRGARPDRCRCCRLRGAAGPLGAGIRCACMHPLDSPRPPVGRVGRLEQRACPAPARPAKIMELHSLSTLRAFEPEADPAHCKQTICPKLSMRAPRSCTCASPVVGEPSPSVTPRRSFRSNDASGRRRPFHRATRLDVRHPFRSPSVLGLGLVAHDGSPKTSRASPRAGSAPVQYRDTRTSASSRADERRGTRAPGPPCARPNVRT